MQRALPFFFSRVLEKKHRPGYFNLWKKERLSLSEVYRLSHLSYPWKRSGHVADYSAVYVDMPILFAVVYIVLRVLHLSQNVSMSEIAENCEESVSTTKRKFHHIFIKCNKGLLSHPRSEE